MNAGKILAALIDRLCHSLLVSGKPRERGCPPTCRLLITKIIVLSEGFSSFSQVY